MSIKKTLQILFSFFLFTSCVSKKKIVYFQKDSIEQEKVSNSYRTVLKPDDLLQITVSSSDFEASKPFNLPAVSFSSNSNGLASAPSQQNHLVDSEGYIDFPVLGRIKLGGKTRKEAISYLKNKLDPDYIKNPTVNIRIANYSITVLGDVQKPGTYTISNERITILEAIGLAGDIRITGKRETIKVFREVDGQKKEYMVDVRSNKIFTSPVYYLQQNDLVYVEPNRASSQDAAYNRNTGLIISVTSILITLVNFIF